ncbi:inactive poly [ADP-ribose] polymerase RCD1-like [Lotus japonicus]|uniref:inactive poly [ADP-ribose] polymerase RCD1-like n=1 Tax=Lotus japonicus TaxID=34305 RepID=UPI0025906862|nr:inactive poly [ADP-ribose] polymerase RCD1-like [Lotus japonicus]
MEAKTALKKSPATQCAAHLKGALRPTIFQQPPFAITPSSDVKNLSRKSYLRYYLNYKRSGRLESMMCYNNGEWLEYPEYVVDLVNKDFEMKKVDLRTSLQQPIAWIDEEGKCFFPEVYATSDEESYNLCKYEGMKLYIQIKVKGVTESNLSEFGEPNALVKYTRVKVGNRKNKMDCDYVGEAFEKNQELLFASCAECVHEKIDLHYVQELFRNGMSSFGSTDFEIVETYRCSGSSMPARFELFRMQAKIIKELHGDANVRYAWLPFNKGELSKMMEYGLGHCPLRATKCSYGIGVHLAAVTCPYASARYYDTDENGVRHLVLCRVIMGKMELLQPCTSTSTNNGQFQPNNFKYDNGVDDIQCPRNYTVWNVNINTHIYPEFVVSFKVSGDLEGHFCGNVGENNVYRANSFGVNSSSHGSGGLLQSPSIVDNGIASNGIVSIQKIPKSSWLPFSMLIAAITDKVTPSDISLINAHYEFYKAQLISRGDFVKELRLIVGDPLLRATIESFQFRIPSNGDLEGLNLNEG